MQRNMIILSLAILTLASCATRIPFTQEIRERYKLKESELKSIQFYASNDIILRRGENQEKSKETDEGTLTITDGKSYEEVKIKAGTPGVVDRVVDGNRLAISFEDGDKKYIVFGDPESKKGPYTLLAADWSNGRGKLQYGGKGYVTTAGASNVYIAFKLKKLNKLTKQEHVVKGKKL